MVNINIVGDFCVPDLNGLYFNDELRRFINEGDINIVNLESRVTSNSARPIF